MASVLPSWGEQYRHDIHKISLRPIYLPHNAHHYPLTTNKITNIVTQFYTLLFYFNLRIENPRNLNCAPAQNNNL